MLTIQPMYGLTNRMLAIDSALALAGELGLGIRVDWARDKHLGCRFGDLFEVPETIGEVVERDHLTAVGQMKDHVMRRLGLTARPDINGWTARALRERKFEWQSLKGARRITIESFERFFPSNRRFADLRPVPSVRDAVAETVARFDRTVGVHVRRGDNRWSREGSPTELFLERMDNAVEAEGNVTFFLATDDPEIEVTMERAFPGRIITYPKRSLDRRTAAAIQDAAIDLFSLAATQRVIGSHISTFSIVAAEIGASLSMWFACPERPAMARSGTSSSAWR